MGVSNGLARWQRKGSSLLIFWLGAAFLAASPCTAVDVQVVAVTPGRGAALVIEGGAPVHLAVGEKVGVVTLVSADSDGATLRIDGVTVNLPLEAYAGPGGEGTGGQSTVRLKADRGGHFVADGTINRRPVRFLVDTGASLTTLSVKEARRIGLRYAGGSRVRTMTANGVVDGWKVELESVRIGSVTVHQVEAVVIDTDLPVALLGMSCLDRFDMERSGSTLVLERRR